ncbi:MAG: metal ABC transporter ATP-binding protein [Planctomycetota bacterium]
MSDLLLSAADLGYRADRKVLRGVDLEIHAGDFLLVAGANGSGKSTLIRSLLGTLPLLGGKREASPDLRLGYVPQHLQIDGPFPVSVADVVRMGLWGPATRSLSKVEAAQRVEQALEAVSMLHRVSDSFGRLSGGQKQRVLVARSLVMRPNLMLLDEPVSGVDAKATDIILGLLHEQAEAGNAVMLVSHHPLALREFANRAVLVKDGKVQALPVPELCSPEGLEKIWA